MMSVREESGSFDELVRQAVRLNLVDGVEAGGKGMLVRLGRLRLDFTEAEASNYLRGLLRVHAREAGRQSGAVGA